MQLGARYQAVLELISEIFKDLKPADGIIEEEGTPEDVFGNPKSAKMRAFLSKSFENI